MEEIITDEHIQNIINNKILNRITSIEYVVSEKCQNNCKYCYRVKKHNKSSCVYVTADDIDLYTENLLDIFKLDKSFCQTVTAELFGGDALLDYQECKKIIDLLYYKYKYNRIIIPTNGRLINELSILDIKDLLYDEKNNKLKASLSLSVDGEINDGQRPLSKFGKMLQYQEDINYDKLIKLSQDFKMGFHPMFSFDNYDSWFPTFKFFFDKGIKPYLLEVRHPLDRNDIFKCIEQLVMIRKYLLNKFGSYDEIKQYNTINPSIIPRGLGCSALTTLTIMPNGDIPFCHRLIDKPWVMGNVLKKEFKIPNAINLISGYHHANHPMCIKCIVRESCGGLCVGANYEYWGDPWTPIPSICDYIITKSYIMSQIFEDWNKTLKAKDTDIKILREQSENIFNNNKKYYNQCNSLDDYISLLKEKEEQ